MRGGSIATYCGRDPVTEKHCVQTGNEKNGTVWLLDDEGFAIGGHKPCAQDVVGKL